MKQECSLTDELIAERRIEEYRKNIYDALQVMGDKPKFRRTAVHAYISLANIWELTQSDAAALLSVSRQSYQAWQAEEFSSIGVDQLEKISCLLGIYRYLYTLYSGRTDRVAAWLCRPNNGAIFGGISPYDLLVGERAEVFHLVRRYLASATV